MKIKIDHDSMIRPECEWSQERVLEWSKWWHSYYQRAHARGLGTNSAKAFKEILGRQTLTVTFRHRNWVWNNEDESWCLYVSKCGSTFHTPLVIGRHTLTPDETWEAWQRFTARVDAAWPLR